MKSSEFKILVTGAAGFIGYHLIKILLQNKFNIVGVDNLNNYYDVNLKLDRLKDCGIECSFPTKLKRKSDKYSNYQFYQVDISDNDTLSGVFEAENFNYVINLAGQAGVRYSIENPVEFVKSNILGFLNILECCKSYNVDNVLYASSSSVYGSCTEYPFRENMNLNNMLNIYAVSKKTNEEIANVYRNLYGMKLCGLRFFSVYGPWGRPDMALMVFTKALLNSEPINLFNNGNHKRDFTYVDDIVKSILLILKTHPAQWAPIYNIGNSNPVKLTTLTAVLEEKLKKKGIYNYCPIQLGDIEVTCADMTLFENQFGRQQFTAFEEGVDNFLKWYLEYYS